MKSYYRIDAKPAASPEAVIQGDHYRFTVLTPWLMRLEYSETGKFEDRATQCVWNREFPVPGFRVQEEENSLKIITEGIHLQYDKQPFSANGL